MERVTLKGLVSLAKYIASEKNVFVPGMRIGYKLSKHDFELLQREVYFHTYNTLEGFIGSEEIEFEIMEITFTFRPI